MGNISNVPWISNSWLALSAINWYEAAGLLHHYGLKKGGIVSSLVWIRFLGNQWDRKWQAS